MFTKPGSKKEVEVLIEDELKSAVVVAEASTKAMSRAVLVGTIPIIEFGAVVMFALLIVNVPLKLFGRMK